MTCSMIAVEVVVAIEQYPQTTFLVGHHVADVVVGEFFPSFQREISSYRATVTSQFRQADSVHAAQVAGNPHVFANLAHSIYPIGNAFACGVEQLERDKSVCGGIVAKYSSVGREPNRAMAVFKNKTDANVASGIAVVEVMPTSGAIGLLNNDSTGASKPQIALAVAHSGKELVALTCINE